MANRDVQEAWKYHNLTKHSPESVRQSGRTLDWRNEPLLHKIYSDLAPLKLPDPDIRTGVSALQAIVKSSAAAAERIPGLNEIANLLYFSAGITRRRKYPGGEMEFRAASCTGALYEIELYLVCGELPGLPAGVYHFSPRDMSLRRLRSGDFRRFLSRATGREEHATGAAAVVISTGTYWRNAWKYGARTYRHFGWDNGTILANLLATAAALDIPAHLVCGFVDDGVNRLLALDADREVSLSLVALGGSSPAPTPPHIDDITFETVALSTEEVDYPEMRRVHTASCLATPDEVGDWRTRGMPPAEVPEIPGTPLQPPPGDSVPQDSIEDVILRRGSSREFRREPITFAQLSTVLEGPLQGIPADFLGPGERLNDVYVIAHAVDGLDAGAYYVRGSRTLEMLRPGNFRKEAAFLGLEQALPGDAAVAIFFLADLNLHLGRFGNRGYRAVQLEAGILGGRIYLGSYAQRLGATGLTFYDDRVVGFFSPHAEHKSAIFLMAVGHSARRAF